MAKVNWGSVSRCQNATPFVLSTLPRKLISRVQACSDNEHFRDSVLQPALRVENSTMTGRRDESMHAHSEEA